MATCKTCANTRTVDYGLDVGSCRDCQPDMRIIHDVMSASGADKDTPEEKEFRHQFATLVARWEELIEYLNPAEHQTPLDRAKELVDKFCENSVIVFQIKELVSRS